MVPGYTVYPEYKTKFVVLIKIYNVFGSMPFNVQCYETPYELEAELKPQLPPADAVRALTISGFLLYCRNLRCEYYCYYY